MYHCINKYSAKFNADEPSPKGYGFCARSMLDGEKLVGTNGKVLQFKSAGFH